jgi:hypothetical protein
LPELTHAGQRHNFLKPYLCGVAVSLYEFPMAVRVVPLVAKDSGIPLFLAILAGVTIGLASALLVFALEARLPG